MPVHSTPVSIAVSDGARVSGLVQRPPGSRACLLLAHGAGAGMRHPFMAAIADDLAGLGIATLRYQFPYMEKLGKRPDPPDVCQATVRAAVAAAQELLPGLSLFAGGKSFGGRMTSQAQAVSPLSGVRGLAFVGFPLHPPQRPSDARAEHLLRVDIPMLFLQGSRDAFAQLGLLRPLIERLGARARLVLIQDADHSFHVPARAGATDAELRAAMMGALAAWIESLL
jgi:predicted alpha/beta-hydrolase family hydrolase